LERVALSEVPLEIGPPPDPPVSVEPVSDLELTETAKRITLPYPEPEYRCPACERSIPTRKQIRMAKPAKYDHVLNDVLKCPWCNFIFSPRVTAAVVLSR
jgi:protein-disulfide isomerase